MNLLSLATSEPWLLLAGLFGLPFLGGLLGGVLGARMGRPSAPQYRYRR